MQTYRSDIDGLRALAVAAVFLFHLGTPGFGGGFLGVDIFFVISGFLITGTLLSDAAGHDWPLLRFYQRRIARIAPALLAVILVTLIAAALLYSRQDFAYLGSDAIAAAASIANIKPLIDSESYFALSPDAKPLLHYWSLSVEEQFYLLFPFYLYAATRWTRRPLAITVILGLFSLLICIAVTRAQPSFAFYLLPTRAWELLAGSALALSKGERPPAPAGSFMGWMGLAVLALSVAVIREEFGVPGWVATIPAMGTMLIIQGGMSGKPLPWLSHPLLTFCGKRSYSLYLWHWPIFSLVDYHFFLSSGIFRIALKLILTAAATLATYSLVERPARRYLSAPRHGRLAYAAFALATIAVCAAGYAIRHRNYLSARPSQIVSGGIAFHGAGSGSVVLMGDSIATMYAPDLAALSHSEGFSLNVVSAAGVNELPGEPSTHWPRVRQFLASQKPSVVVLFYSWELKSAEFHALPEHLGEALDIMRRDGTRVILVCSAPRLPPQATREGMRAGARPPFFETPADRANRLRACALLRSFGRPDTIIIDPAPRFAGAFGEIALMDPDGTLRYVDSHHLTEAGTRLVIPLLNAALARAVP